MTASVRSEDKAQQLLKTNPSWEGKIQFGFMSKLTTPNAFEKLFDKSYDFIVHAASPVIFTVKDIQKDLIDPTVLG